jgi:serine/threonine protein kinase
MLVVDPQKRFTISQIVQHRWMQHRRDAAPQPSEERPSERRCEYNEQLLRLMQSLGIDPKKTVEVGCFATNSVLSFSLRYRKQTVFIAEL